MVQRDFRLSPCVVRSHKFTRQEASWFVQRFTQNAWMWRITDRPCYGNCVGIGTVTYTTRAVFSFTLFPRKRNQKNNNKLFHELRFLSYVLADFVGDRRSGINQAVIDEVQSVFQGKTLQQLELLEKTIHNKLHGGEGVDVGTAVWHFYCFFANYLSYGIKH